MPMRNEAQIVAALFRRAVRPRPDPGDVERREVEDLVLRALDRAARREMRQVVRALFARIVVDLIERGWKSDGDGLCAECAQQRAPHPLWSRRRPRYVRCPRGHRLHVECLRLRAVDSALAFDADCPRCLRALAERAW